MSFDKNTRKGLSNKYSQKLLDSAKSSTTDATRTASKRAVEKAAEETGDLVGNKIVDKIEKSLQRKYINKNNLDKANNEISKEGYISPEKRQQTIYELRLV